MPEATPNPATNPTPGETGDNPAGNGTPNPQPTPTPDPEPAPKTFTQEELDRLIAERLKREQNKYKDYEDLKAKAAKLKEIEDAQKTEAQKQADKLAELEANNQRLTQAATEAALRAVVVSEAAKAKFADPLDAYRLLDVSALKLAEDGTVTGLADALKKLATEKPYLLVRTQPATPTIQPTNPSTTKTGETDTERRQRYFGGGKGDFWKGGGVAESTASLPPKERDKQ